MTPLHFKVRECDVNLENANDAVKCNNFLWGAPRSKTAVFELVS